MAFLEGIEEFKDAPLLWQEYGLHETASGYGARLTTRWKVRVGKRWFRVYVQQYSNVGTLFVEKGGEKWVVRSSDLP
jgi:hypothetical protein